MYIIKEDFVFIIHPSEENITASKEDGTMRQRGKPTKAEGE